jgi:aryl sulfotransferase
VSPSTVWLASYPKSGNTWMRALLGALMAQEETDDPLDINDLRGEPFAASRHHVERYLGFPASDLAPAEVDALRPACDAELDRSLSETRLRKIHDAVQTLDGQPLVSSDSARAAIYLVRDPRDVAVSLAHFFGRPMRLAVKLLGNPASTLGGCAPTIGRQLPQPLGTWSEHVLGWVRQDAFPVVVVRYEDLLVDAGRELTRAAALAGLHASPERIAAAVEAARFEKLQHREDDVGFAERPTRATRFFRRGEAGAWRDELPRTLAAKVERDHGDVMAMFRYERELTGVSA